MLKVNRETLSKALVLAQTCVEVKGTIPALQFALFEAKNGRLAIQATDLDVTLDTSIECEGEDATFCAPAKDLTRLVGLFDGDTVGFTPKENDRIAVSCGRSKYTLPSLKREHWPNIEPVTGKHFLIKGSMLKTLLERAVLCVSDLEHKTAKTGVLLETITGKLHAVAMDGSRGVILRYPILFSEKLSGVVPRKAALAIMQAFPTDDPLFVTIADGVAKCEQGETSIRTRLLMEQFPNYELFIPKKVSHSVAISGDSRGVLKRSAVTAEGISLNRSPLVLFEVSKEGTQVKSKDADRGEGVELIETKCATLNGDSVPLKFASKYLSELLALEPEINFAFEDNNTQFLLTPTGLRDYQMQYVIAPCRL